MKIIDKIIKTIVGQFIFSVGIVMTINANLGLAPWDVFHQGLAHQLNITMGQAAIIVGFILIIVNLFLGESIGWGTVANMIFIGIFMDVLMENNLIPIFDNMFLQFFMMILGLFIIGIASYVYLSLGLGSGPRDGLMIALTKRFKIPVRFIRSAIEIGVLIIGYFLGGQVGIGTLFMAVTIGYFVQFAFKIFNYDVDEQKHRFIQEDIKYIKSRIDF